ncbi:MAG TPA: geranylgeranylglycerol-phosphate geranylgeranyltransferase [Gemmatimonadales bacterium]|nr:geranylgeranylglycerol-phosphate geranylgeranyltransferase [Gemmatimonadales bacterium]
MLRSRAASALALVRPRNLLIAAAGVAVGGFLALGRVAFPAPLLWAMASALGLGGAGNAANDVFDLEADRINRPLRPLVTGALSRETAIVVAGVAGGFGLFAAWWVSRALFVLALLALAVMLAYSPWLKSRGFRGNLAVAVVASLPLIYGAVAVGNWRAGLVPSALAALLHLAREIVKDVEDVAGDLALDRRTVPIVWGTEAGFLAASGILAVFVPLSLLPWAAGWYGWRYGLVVSALDLGLLVLIARLARGRLAGARSALKAAMVVGLAALLWDRL